MPKEEQEKEEKEQVTLVCTECKKESIFEKEELEGYTYNWKCQHCYTIIPYLPPPKVTFRCTMPTPKRGKRIRR